MCDMDTESPVIWPAWCYSGAISIEAGVQRKNAKLPRTPESMNNMGASEYHTPHTNNNIKDERLSPETSDTSSGSLTPSSASYPSTPPASDHGPLSYVTGRNYSDFIRNLAAKYNKNNHNDYYDLIRQGYNIESRLKSTSLFTPQNVKDDSSPKAEIPNILAPFSGAPFSQLIDMSATQTLFAMIQTAREEELQSLLKQGLPTKRVHGEVTSPLDLSATTCLKRSRARSHRPRSERCHASEENVSTWTVDDVCNFVESIDICAEYTEKFREQRIDGAGLPLLTEEHLTTKINMKLGPALKLKSILAKKMGSCSICLHCVHCHTPPSESEMTDTLNNVDMKNA